MDKYSASVQWSEEDDGYIASVPELPGLSAFGETVEKAIKELNKAKKIYLAAYEEDGCRLPEPQKLMRYSGQIRLRMPKTLHAELANAAKSEGVSLNSYLNHLISANHSIHLVEKRLDNVEDKLTDIHIDNLKEKPATEQSFAHIGYFAFDQPDKDKGLLQ